MKGVPVNRKQGTFFQVYCQCQITPASESKRKREVVRRAKRWVFREFFCLPPRRVYQLLSPSSSSSSSPAFVSSPCSLRLRHTTWASAGVQLEEKRARGGGGGGVDWVLQLRNVAERKNMAIKGSHFHSVAVMSLLKYFLLPSLPNLTY